MKKIIVLALVVMFGMSAFAADFKQVSRNQITIKALTKPAIDSGALKETQAYFEFINSACADGYYYMPKDGPGGVALVCSYGPTTFETPTGLKKIKDGYVCAPKGIIPDNPCPAGLTFYNIGFGFYNQLENAITDLQYLCGKMGEPPAEVKCANGFKPIGDSLKYGYTNVHCGGLYNSEVYQKCIQTELEADKTKPPYDSMNPEPWNKWFWKTIYDASVKCCPNKGDLLYTYNCENTAPIKFAAKKPSEVCQNGYTPLPSEANYIGPHPEVCCLLLEDVK